MTRKKAIIALVVVAVIGLAAWGMNRRANRAAASQNQNQYAQLPVTRGDVVLAITESGTVEAESVRKVTTEYGGTVKAVHVGNGAKVMAGQPLLSLQNYDLDDKIQSARYALETAQLNMDNALDKESDIKSAQLKVSQAELSLKNLKSQQDKLTIKAPIAGTVYDLDLAAGEELTANGAVATLIDSSQMYLHDTIDDLDLAETKVGQRVKVNIGADQITFDGTITKIAQEGTGNAQSGYAYYDVEVLIGKQTDKGTKLNVRPGMAAYFYFNEYGPGDEIRSQGGTIEAADRAEVTAKVAGTVDKVLVENGDIVTKDEIIAVLTDEDLGTNITHAEVELELAKDNLNKLYDNSDLRSLEIKLEQAQSDLASLLEQAAELVIVAPSDGEIIGDMPKVADKFSDDATVLSIMETNNMLVRISVDELDVPKLRVGQVASVTVDALAGKVFEGEITEIGNTGSASNGVTTYDLLVRIEEPEGVLAGMSASVSITLDKRENVLLVPAETVQTRGNQTTVQKKTDGGIETVVVETGLTSEAAVEIISGLEEGDIVIYSATSSTSGTQRIGGGNMVIMGGGPPGGQTQRRSTGQ